MANGNFANFRAVYEDLTYEVTRARHQFLPDHLRNWFEVIDETPSVHRVVEQLQGGLDLPAWLQQNRATPGLMGLGNASMQWPESRDKRLGMQLLLFRAAARGEIDISQMGFHFTYAGSNINDNARAFIEQVFAPMARDFRRYLEQQVGSSGVVPASDRVVRLDHNSSAYQDAMQALETLERVLQEANDYDDPEDKDQRVSEVSATRRLLGSTRVRLAGIVAVVGPTLHYLGKKFIDSAIGKAAGATLDRLINLLGQIF
jgi:hypothetical protein